MYTEEATPVNLSPQGFSVDTLITPNESGPISTPTIILSTDVPAPIPLSELWSEVQTSDGRVYYYNGKSGDSQWQKPLELQNPEEAAVSNTDWKQYKIWDGRSFFYNEKTKCSVWATPPEVLIAQASSSDKVDPQYYACVEFEKSFKSVDAQRAEFQSLLIEKGVDERLSFTEAMSLVSDDPRFESIPDDETRRIFFASFLSFISRKRIQEERNRIRSFCIESVRDWKEWKGMSESTTFAQMEAVFKGFSWYSEIDRLTLVELYQVFSTEFIEIERLKKRKLQDTLMQELKNDILGRLTEFDLSSLSVVDLIFQTYNKADPKPQFWTYLSDSQRLIVIKSCIAQRVREVRMSVVNQLPLSRERRSRRQEKDEIKRILGEVILSSKESSGVVSRGQSSSMSVPKWTSEIERAVLAKSSLDLRIAKELFNEYVEDMKKGKNPLEGL